MPTATLPPAELSGSTLVEHETRPGEHLSKVLFVYVSRRFLKECGEGADFAELPSSQQSFHALPRCISDVYTTILKYLWGEI